MMKWLHKTLQPEMTDEEWKTHFIEMVFGAVGTALLLAFMAFYSHTN